MYDKYVTTKKPLEEDDEWNVYGEFPCLPMVMPVESVFVKSARKRVVKQSDVSYVLSSVLFLLLIAFIIRKRIRNEQM